MENRRDFLKKTALAGMAAVLPAFSCSPEPARARTMKTREPRSALVLFYGQTGHTRRMGRIIAGTWERLGIRTEFRDIRGFDASSLGGYDLIALGCPVFYWDAPENVKAWLGNIPSIEGTPVAAFVTYGGGGNSRNSAMSVLELAAAKGGVPAGLAAFPNMSSFAPTWSILGPERTLRYRDLPDEDTFARARRFAGTVLDSVRDGRAMTVDREFTITDQIRGASLLGLYKSAVGRHRINGEKCVRCGTCSGLCPVGAINPEAGNVDRDRCILCLGCVNNCPAGAVEMSFLGYDVYGFRELLSRNNVVIHEPVEETAIR